MKNNRNHVQLNGRLGANPEVRTFEDGKSSVRFCIAVPEFRKTEDGQKVYDVQWHAIIMWGGMASKAAMQLHKGSEVIIRGRLLKRSYTSSDGKKRDVCEILATGFTLPPIKQAA